MTLKAVGKLKAIGSHLQTLKPTISYVQQEPISRDAQRLIFSPWRRWYKTARWQALRLKIFTRDMFTCQWPGCGRIEGNTSLLVADHKQLHHGDERLFWDEGNLQTLCKPCHDRLKQRQERAERHN